MIIDIAEVCYTSSDAFLDEKQIWVQFVCFRKILAIFGLLEKFFIEFKQSQIFSGKQTNSNFFSGNDKFEHFRCFLMS